MNGRRVYPDEDGDLWLKEGDYGKSKNGHWMARPHTITVSPSILITGETTWHGYLERGVWRKV